MAALHGRRWRRQVGRDGEAGAMLLGRTVVELHAGWRVLKAFIEARARSSR